MYSITNIIFYFVRNVILRLFIKAQRERLSVMLGYRVPRWRNQIQERKHGRLRRKKTKLFPE